ncbi:MAG: DUF3090 domain-containing protein [Anaerolineae bacterium]|nr:DUF3090 domain-containing protein [Anaerolineae bacterium]
MPRSIYDLDPVSAITADAVGEPGKRVFYLQARQGKRTVTLLIEKEQVRALATGIDQLIEQMEQKLSRPSSEQETPLQSDLVLQEPLDPEFRVGQMGLGFDEERGMIILIAQEAVAEGEDADNAAVARFWATRGQMRALSRHAQAVVEQGRPTCPLCGQPIDPTGHFCPPRNGHNRQQAVLP